MAKNKKKQESEDESDFNDDSDDNKKQKKPAAKKGKVVKKADKSKKSKSSVKSKSSQKSKPAQKSRGKSNNDDDDEEMKEEDSYDYTQDFMPGQKSVTPDEDNGIRVFYESLHKQNPNSEMAQKYCMENGLLEEGEAKKTFAKFNKKKK